MKRLVLIILNLLILSAATAQIPYELKNRWWEGYLAEAGLPLNISMQNALSDWSDINAEAARSVASLLAQYSGMPSDSIINDLTPVFYSPSQTKQPFPATDFSFANDTLRMVLGDLGVKMTLAYNRKDNTFAGTFRQGMMKTDITFTPCDTLSSFNRPQTPQPPYSFIGEQVTIRRKDKNDNEIVITGTLAIPTCPAPTKGGYPAAVLVSGSGQQNRDSELFLHKPFLVWAEELAKQGIATLRYDDRGTGGSTGDYTKATSYDYADDAEAVFDFLRKHEKIDAKHCGIVGHSEGGMIAPLVAARNKKVTFVVMLAGPGCKGSEVLYQQNEVLIRNQVEDPTLRAIALGCSRELFDVVPNTSEDAMSSTVMEILARHTRDISKEQARALGLHKGNAIMLAQQYNLPWMKTFMQIDPSVYLPKVKCPIMAVNGEKDSQVLSEPNIKAIQEHATSCPRLVCKTYPKLNHLFQECETGLSKEYIFIEQSVAPQVMDDVAKFIHSTHK